MFTLRMRMKPDGSVAVSVPLGCRVEDADLFVKKNSGWIAERLLRAAERRKMPLPPMPTAQRTREMLSEALARVYPLVVPLGVAMPVLKLRFMKSQWGNCHWRQGYITLNTALARCPEELRDYVALHELVHFLHPNHGAGFRSVMDELMPDWKGRRNALEQYSGALMPEGTTKERE